MHSAGFNNRSGLSAIYKIKNKASGWSVCPKYKAGSVPFFEFRERNKYFS